MKKKLYSKSIAKAIIAFLTREKWEFFFDREEGKFEFSVNVNGGLKEIKYDIYVFKNGYIVYALYPMCVDKTKKQMMGAMAEFICRVNMDLNYGNLELDVNDGFIWFKYDVDCDGAAPAQNAVKSSIYCPGILLGYFGEGITEITAGASAEEAYERCMEVYEKKLRMLAVAVGAEGHRDSGMNASSDSRVIVRLDPFSGKGGAA